MIVQIKFCKISYIPNDYSVFNSGKPIANKYSSELGQLLVIMRAKGYFCALISETEHIQYQWQIIKIPKKRYGLMPKSGS